MLHELHINGRVLDPIGRSRCIIESGAGLFTLERGTFLISAPEIARPAPPSEKRGVTGGH